MRTLLGLIIYSWDAEVIVCKTEQYSNNFKFVEITNKNSYKARLFATRNFFVNFVAPLVLCRVNDSRHFLYDNPFNLYFLYIHLWLYIQPKDFYNFSIL